MSFIEDSNIIKRGGLEGLEFSKNEAKYVLKNKLYETSEGMMEIKKINDEFKRKNLSPGGCADFLILTLYFYLLEDYIDWIQTSDEIRKKENWKIFKGL